ncbi:MAG: efflux RND transporter periplasmic adaptor subunit [Bacteroidetes bacterium]|nr:efflux RND transporter periplasmic adaptor subunit [Bacteroidota bacterium]
MKSIIKFNVAMSLLLLIAACGGSNELEKKKAKVEGLKAQQAEIASEIKSLEAEIAAIGDTNANANEKVKYVKLTTLTQTEFLHYIDVQGRVDGDQNNTISARAMGPVTKIYVKPGSRVTKDQLLAELDAEIVKTQIADLKTSLAFATDVFNKQKALWEKQVGTEVQYLSAKNNKESLEQKLQTLYENLDMYRIKAPFSGTVDEVFIKVGSNVAPGVPCIRVVNFNNLKAKADVAETYASQIKEGNDVMLLFPDLNNKTIKGKIDFTSRVINQMTRTFTIESELQNDADLIPNMICVFKVVDYKSPKAIVIPINTVQKNESEVYVMISEVVDGKQVAVQRNVTLGKIYNDKAEIIAGLKEGDKLIFTGYNDLNNNELIKE